MSGRLTPAWRIGFQQRLPAGCQKEHKCALRSVESVAREARTVTQLQLAHRSTASATAVPRRNTSALYSIHITGAVGERLRSYGAQ